MAVEESDLVDLDRAILTQAVPGPVAIFSAETIRSSIPYPEPLERVPAHILVFPVRGELEHTVDFARFPASPGQVVHVYPGQVQRWDFTRDFDAKVLIVRPHAIPAGVFGVPGHSAVSSLGDRATFVLDVLRQIEKLSQMTERNAVNEGLVLDLSRVALRFVALGELRPAGNALPGQDLLNEFRALLDKHIESNREIADFARELGVSVKTLARVTERLVGRTPKDVRDERVVTEAKRLIALTDLSLGAVGRRLGFPEQSNFTKFFARVTGETPASFRSSLNPIAERQD